jgi:hypothetical protein
METQEAVKSLWDSRKDKAVRRLGTFGEAQRLLDDLNAADIPTYGTRADLFLHCESPEKSEDGKSSTMVQWPDDRPVGDPKDVHHIIPPHHSIGYLIEECPDGFTLETLETRFLRREVLRQRGKIIGIMLTSMVRNESYGAHEVIG